MNSSRSDRLVAEIGTAYTPVVFHCIDPYNMYAKGKSMSRVC